SEAYRIYSDNTYGTTIWNSASNIQNVGSGAEVFTQTFNTPGVFNGGQTQAYLGGTGTENGGHYVYSTILQNRGTGLCDQSVIPPRALDVVKSAAPAVAGIGDAITYTLATCNNGNLAVGGSLCSDNFNDGKVSPYH